MSAILVEQFLPGVTQEQLGAKATAVSMPGMRTSIALRQYDADDSFVSAWVMIGTILGCLVIMMTVVFAAATSMS